MKIKNFDCVAMKRAAADKIYEQLKDTSPTEQRAFWKAGEDELRSRCRGVISPESIAKAA
jgi:hypothetical protein